MTLTLYIYQNPNNANKVRLQAQGSLNLPAAQGGAANNPCSAHGSIDFSGSRLCVGSAGNTLTYSAIAVANTSNFIDYQPALLLTGLSSSVVSSSAPYVFLNAWPNYPDTPTPVFHISPNYVSGTPIYSYSDFSGTFAQLGFGSTTGTLGTWQITGTNQLINVEFGPPPASGNLTFYIFENPNNSNKVRLQAQGSLKLGTPLIGPTSNACSSLGAISFLTRQVCAGTFGDTSTYEITSVNSSAFNNYLPKLNLGGVLASANDPSLLSNPSPFASLDASSNRFHISPNYVSGTPICSYSDFSGTFAQLGFGSTTGTLGTWMVYATAADGSTITNTVDIEFGYVPPCGSNVLTFYIFENPNNSNKVRLQAQGSLNLPAAQGGATANPSALYGTIDVDASIISAGTVVNTLSYGITPVANNGNFLNYNPSALILDGISASPSTAVSPHVGMYCSAAYSPVQSERFFIAPGYVSGTPICTHSDFSGTFAQLGFGTTTGTLGTWQITGTNNYITIQFGYSPPCDASPPAPPIPPTPFVPPAAPDLPSFFLPQIAATSDGCKEEARPYVTFSSARSVDHASVHDPYPLGREASFSLLLGGMIGAEYGTQTLFFSFETLQPARIGLRKANHDRPYIDQYVDLHLSGPDGLIPLGSDNFANSSLLQGGIKHPSGQVVTTADVTVDLGYAECDYWTTGYAVSDCASAVVPVTTAVDIPDPGDPLRSPFGAIMPPAVYGFTVSSSQWPQLPFCVELAVIPPVTPLVSGLISRAEPVARLALVKLEGIAWGSSAATGALAGAKRLSGIADAQAAPLATITRVSPYSE